MDKSHPGKTTFMIMVSPLPGKDSTEIFLPASYWNSSTLHSFNKGLILGLYELCDYFWTVLKLKLTNLDLLGILGYGMCKRHDKTSWNMSCWLESSHLIIEIQTIKKQPHSFLCFNPHRNNIYSTSAIPTFVEIPAHKHTKMKPNFPLNLILMYYNFLSCLSS